MKANTLSGSRFGLFQGVLPIQRPEIWKDVIAGVTLAALGIPEVMGYTHAGRLEKRTCGPGNAIYVAVVGAPTRIHFNFDPLSRPHVLELSLLKVRRDPDQFQPREQ